MVSCARAGALIGLFALLGLGCEPEGSGSCGRDHHNVTVINSPLSSQYVVDVTERPVGDVLTELTNGLEGELRLAEPDESLGLARLRYEFAGAAKATPYDGDCTVDEVFEIKATAVLETLDGENIAWRYDLFLHSSQVAVEWIAGPGHAVFSEAYWSMVGEEPHDVLGCMSIGGRFEPGTELLLGVGPCHYDRVAMQMDTKISGVFTPSAE